MGDVTTWFCEDNQNLWLNVNSLAASTSQDFLKFKPQFPESITAKHTRTGGNSKSVVFCHYTLWLS